MRRDILEERLLRGIRAELEKDEVLSYVLRQVRQTLDVQGGSSELERTCKRRDDLQNELSRLADAIAKSGGSDFLLKTLKEKEQQLKSVSACIAAADRAAVEIDAGWLKKRISEELSALPALLGSDPERARTFLLSRVNEVQMVPRCDDGEKYYVAEATWLIGGNTKTTGAKLNSGLSMLSDLRDR